MTQAPADSAPLISVVTVCFNSAATLPATLDSLRSQVYVGFEYVVVDGGSKDGSLSILECARDRIDTLVSEPDAGIYDAMNKGTRLARGEYVYFLNSDDRLADENVLEDLARYLQDNPKLDLLYGNAVYVAPDGQRSRQRYSHVNARNLVFANLCHQAVFARRSLFERLGSFDLSFHVVADLDWLVRVLRSGASHRWIDRDICLYATEGFSAQQRRLLNEEKRRMQARLHGQWVAAAGRLGYRLARRLR